MAEVQTLLGEMQSLQKDSDMAKRREGKGAAVHAEGGVSAAYVSQLERKVKALEEENRLLRQRDIMNRLLVLDGPESEAGAKPAAAAGAPPALSLGLDRTQLVAFQPFAAEKAAANDTRELDERRRSMYEATTPRGTASRSKWVGLSWAGVLLRRGKSSGKVHPVKGKPKPPPKLTKAASKMQATDRAAIKIQAVWRGKQMRDELAYWDTMGY